MTQSTCAERFPQTVLEVAGIMTSASKSSSDESHLMVRHLDGDAQAFPEIVTMYKDRVYSYIVRCGVAESQRDDLFQEIFLRIHTRAKSYDISRPLAPWIFGITVNTLRTVLAQNKRSTSSELDEEVASDEPSALSKLEAREAARLLEEELKKLPLALKEAFLLCCTEKMDQADAAHTLGIPLNTLKTNLRRARLFLAKSFERRNATLHRELQR